MKNKKNQVVPENNDFVPKRHPEGVKVTPGVGVPPTGHFCAPCAGRYSVSAPNAPQLTLVDSTGEITTPLHDRFFVQMGPSRSDFEVILVIPGPHGHPNVCFYGSYYVYDLN